MKLFDSELRVMEVLWALGAVPARTVAAELAAAVGWNKNTTYTVIKKCVEKGAIERSEPNFICRPLFSREQVQGAELDELVDKFFDGSADLLFASLVGRKKLSADAVEKLTKMIGGTEDEPI